MKIHLLHRGSWRDLMQRWGPGTRRNRKDICPSRLLHREADKGKQTGILPVGRGMRRRSIDRKPSKEMLRSSYPNKTHTETESENSLLGRAASPAKSRGEEEGQPSSNQSSQEEARMSLSSGYLSDDNPSWKKESRAMALVKILGKKSDQRGEPRTEKFGSETGPQDFRDSGRIGIRRNASWRSNKTIQSLERVESKN